MFSVQKSCCVFAQFKKMLYICGKIRTCGRTQQNCLILIVVCAQLGSTCDVLSIVAPRRGSLYNKYTRSNQTRNAKNNGRKIRIKDIAERAGVSVGTVDRVLHDRPNVSKPARDKVEKALKEMNYQPNVYASALAYNKSYTFYLLIPKHESEAYWEEIEEGAKNVKIPDVTSISM